MSRKTSIEVTLLVLAFLGLTALTLYGFSRPWRPETATQHGHAVDVLISYLLVTTGVLFVAGHVVLAVLLLRYRGNGPSVYRPVSARAEWLTALAPVLLMTILAEVGVLFLGMPVWGQVYGEPPADAFHVELVGKQFSWTVRYPGPDGQFGKVDPALVDDDENPLGIVREDPAGSDDIVEIGVMHLPLGRQVAVRLRSHDVLHSFSVAPFRVKQDIVPGLTQRTRFVADKAGRYEIACAELCGLGHYRMRGFCNVLALEEFESWLSEQTPWTENF